MNTATHPVAPEEVMAFLDGELSAERAQIVSTHIDECTECQKFGDSFRSTSQSLAGWAIPAVPERIEEQVSTGVVNIKNLPANQFVFDLPKFLGRRSTWAWSGAALAALLLFVGLSFELSPRMAMRQSSARPEATALQRVEPIELSPYQAKLPAGGRSGGGDGAVAGVPRARTHGGDDKFSTSVDNAEVQSLEDEGESSQERKPAWTPSAPMIARTASLSIFVKDFEAGRAALDGIMARHNGYAANLNVSTPQGAARVIQASLRIPAPQLAAALNELKALGRVEAESQGGEEVTQQHADLVARLKNSRETEQRLQDVLRTRTGKVKDVLEVEEEIARVRGEIEEMEAEQKALEHRVDFATIDLKLSEEYKAQLNTPAPSVWMQLHNAGVNGFRNAFETLLGIVLFFVESGPSIVLWLTILGFPAWLLWRRYRRAHSLGSLVGA